MHKGAFLQRFSVWRVFKELGVAKRYCGINLIAIPLFKDSRQPGSGPALAETVLGCGCADEARECREFLEKLESQGGLVLPPKRLGRPPGKAHAFVLKGTRGALSTRNTQFCYLVDYALCLLVVLTDAVAGLAPELLMETLVE